MMMANEQNQRLELQNKLTHLFLQNGGKGKAAQLAVRDLMISESYKLDENGGLALAVSPDGEATTSSYMERYLEQNDFFKDAATQQPTEIAAEMDSRKQRLQSAKTMFGKETAPDESDVPQESVDQYLRGRIETLKAEMAPGERAALADKAGRFSLSDSLQQKG
jgi:hypothetical protein